MRHSPTVKGVQVDWNVGDRVWHNDYPPQTPHNVEIPETGLAQLLRDTAARTPHGKAIVFLDSIMTYARLDDMVDRLAASLHDLGLAKGDTLALMLPNSHQFVVGYYAGQRLGLKVTAINPLYKPLEVAHQLRDSGARALIVLDAIYKSVASALPDSPVEFVIGTNIVDLCDFSGLKVLLGKALKKIPTGKMPSSALKLKNLVARPAKPPEVVIDPVNDIACLQYTGGTTGLPKGAMLTAHNLVANAIQCQAWLGGKGEGMGFVGVLPLFHIYAMTCVMNIAITVGAFQLLLPRPPDDMTELFKQIVRWGMDAELAMPGVAALFNKINHTPQVSDYDLSPLTKCLSAAGPLPKDVQITFEELTPAVVVEGYGLTEASPVCTGNTFFDKRKIGSVGIPFPSTDIRISDLETEEVLPPGMDNLGMVCVRGPQVMAGYYNSPEESAACLKDGWLHTGDIGCMDEEGWLYIRDRARDLVKHKGFSVFPAEVEDYMFAHPDILEAAVVGLPHPKVGEILKAFVVLKPEAAGRATAEDIKAWCAENMTGYKVPSEIEFIDELPKTLVGKTLRRVLRDQEMDKLED